jgi:type VI secretion system protein ImpA
MGHNQRAGFLSRSRQNRVDLQGPGDFSSVAERVPLNPMRSPNVVDITELLAPIAGESPAGSDLRASRRASGPFAMLKLARTAARAAERKIAVADEDGQGARPNWRPVHDLATKILQEESKDLEVATYLVEALVRLHGFAGLRDGFRVCRCLVEDYWDELYPAPDHEGLTGRVAALMSLNGFENDGTLIAPILTIPLTGTGPPGPYSHAHYDQALRTETLTDAAAKKRRVDRGAITMKQFVDAVAQTPVEFYVRLAGEIDECRAEFDALRGLLDELCGDQAPHSSNIRNALESCHDAVHSVAKEKLAAAAAMAGNGAGWLAPATPAPPQVLNGYPADGAEVRWSGAGPCHMIDDNSPARSASGVPSREHALIMLQEIAEYFRRTEPHSPIAYSLEQAVRWGRTPLPKLLEELIPDPGGREHYFRLVGIPPQARNP